MIDLSIEEISKLINLSALDANMVKMMEDQPVRFMIPEPMQWSLDDSVGMKPVEYKTFDLDLQTYKKAVQFYTASPQQLAQCTCPMCLPMNEAGSDLNVAEILEAAANRLEKFGWIQGKLYKVGHGYCAVGAIKESSFGQTYDMIVVTAIVESYLKNYMKKHDYFTDDIKSIPQWNDQPGRENFEVIDLMRQAAKEWRNEHESS